MSSPLKLTCQCGSLKASVDLPAQQAPTRLVCFCEDCRACVRYLQQGSRILDSHGGIDLIQVSPAHFHITGGREHLGNLMLSSQGSYRWYASCCNTPICITPHRVSMPYVGLLTRNLRTGGKKLEQLIGPIRFGVGAGRLHPLPVPFPVSKGFGIRGTLGTLRQIARWRMAGDHQHSELIDAQTGLPAVAPRILTSAERDALYAH
ncbi:MAG: hypothetical protein HKN42_20220 [Granulosicoccus sp.]|nr:hypothetical protein [Granulosicoccus sp.]